ncbi:reverse transcriptase/maturase family protein [Salinispora pacifica]|uniref:reverse transcriptase/maturase family protein n=1 Tax=Salinispora pacifica TaxID=351187 RepID=UPI00307B2419
MVLEPIFEADFRPCSYGFRPSRRAQDAIAETRMFTTKGYEWIVEGDIKACFDEISHPALMDRGASTHRRQAHPDPGEGVPEVRPAHRGRASSRYADDWLLLVIGTRQHAEALKEEIAEVLSGIGLLLSPEKTSIPHIDEGVDFLGWRIQRHRKKGTNKRYVYT